MLRSSFSSELSVNCRSGNRTETGNHLLLNTDIIFIRNIPKKLRRPSTSTLSPSPLLLVSGKKFGYDTVTIESQMT